MMDCAYCFITGRLILAYEFADNGGTDTARFTNEFDAWISEEGQQAINNEYKTGELNPEWKLIWEDWNT